MKMSPEFAKAQANMQPGVITSDGFLGDDTRPIVEIIAADEETMGRFGIDFDDAIERMRYLMQQGRGGLGEPVTVDDAWIVQVYEARGFLASPFEDGIYRKVNAQVTVKTEGSDAPQILFSELSLHLMEKYHFLQGKGSSFRIEPERLKAVLYPAGKKAN
ncbi:MAG: hypothetical protein EA382_09545 [Spirochaetaceae bacterium]|nr:MAG: hypothetical protein EA382_09545 [Spirochaetaceae bacterium]